MTDYEDPSSSPEDEQHLWNELDRCISTQCDTHESIDDALRSWLDVVTKLRDHYPDSQDQVSACAHILLGSETFCGNKDYVRTQIIHSLLQEDDAAPLHVIASLLLLDGQADEALFPRMIEEACFPRLLELIKAESDGDSRLHRMLLHLMYEMSRIERLRVDDLALVDDEFIHYLFRLIEHVSDDVHDPYHYPTIRVLLVLNEQYMLASTDSPTDPSNGSAPLTNRIVKCISLHGPSFRTFGENIILLLNRETETSLQLLILKLLYLLFTTKATYEYFYTNDLRVLLDVIIRNLMDLPYEKISLRHTYLRVMYPLLAHTQLSQPPHYKREEILRVLQLLRGSQNAHFAPADETTLRLVSRVSHVTWLELGDSDRGNASPVEGEVARKKLGISLSRSQTESSVSVSDVAAVMEKPGVQTPSRTAAEAGAETGEGVDGDVPEEGHTITARAKKILPAVPKHRHGIPFTTGQKVPLLNGSAKKVPPKAPPPRRWGRMRTAEVPPAEPIQEKVE
ncbi:Protein dip1 [Paramyrothecium foliicola]|nr:Protein dip1 [Paramyrothecium foliicola]